MTDFPSWTWGAVLALAVVAIGTFVAMLFLLQRSSPQGPGTSEPRVRPSPPPISADAPPADVPPASEPPEPAVGPPVPTDEVMRVIRDRETGQLRVEVEGRGYSHIREIADAQVGHRVLLAAADLIHFTGGMATNPRAVQNAMSQVAGMPAPPPPPARPVRQETGEPLAPRAEGLGTEGTLASGTLPLASAPARERYSLAGFFLRGFQPQAETGPEPAPLTFIDEIEEILQKKIQDLSTPLPYAVHVTTREDGMLQIEVGLKKYGIPDDVPDSGVRELIRAAVREWERR